jgi:pyruvate,water dikinase
MALREHGKFLLIQIMDELRQAILEVGLIHVKNRTLNSIDDIWFLTVEEVLDSLNWNGEMLKDTVSRQKSIYEVHSKLIPPTVLTSEGECINIHPNTTEIPAGALRGLGVSSGVTEGVAKVVIDPTLAVLNSGEILVARSTDPGWTPLFINASAVVMEVGSYLTHGSVVSREYNLPAVSCVTNATAIIKTGMKLRVDGTRGFVQILSTEDNLMQ